MPGRGGRRDPRRGGPGGAHPWGDRGGDPPRVPLFPLLRRRLRDDPSREPARAPRGVSRREGPGGGDGPFLPLSAPHREAYRSEWRWTWGRAPSPATLVDLSDGTVLSRATADNPQMACGEDLIARVVFAEETAGGFELLRGRLLSGVDGVVRRLLEAASVPGEVTDVVAAREHRPLHFLYGISPSPIRRPPYHPVRKEYPSCRERRWEPARRRRGRRGGSSRPSEGSSAATSWRASSPRGCTGRRRSACSSTSAPTGRWCWGTGIGGSPAPPPPGPPSRGARSGAGCARTRERSSRSGSLRGPRRRSGR